MKTMIDIKSNKSMMNNIVADRKYGKNWNELFEYQQDGITKIWYEFRRDIIEKILGEW